MRNENGCGIACSFTVPRWLARWGRERGRDDGFQGGKHDPRLDAVHSQTGVIARIDPTEPGGDGRAMNSHYNAFAGGDVGRIEALSDGIFAFAATVLMLDFRSPEPADIHSEAELLSALIASSHRLMPWLLSLLTLGIFWVPSRRSSANSGGRTAI
jgi:hypothetical protein